jgi:hypothetical protein
MAPDYEHTFHDRSEYGRGRDGDYHTPSGAPRALSVGERARLMRGAGIADTLPNGTDPEEYGERVG